MSSEEKMFVVDREKFIEEALKDYRAQEILYELMARKIFEKHGDEIIEKLMGKVNVKKIKEGITKELIERLADKSEEYV